MPRTSTGAGVTVTSRVLSILGSFDAEHPSLALHLLRFDIRMQGDNETVFFDL